MNNSSKTNSNDLFTPVRETKMTKRYPFDRIHIKRLNSPFLISFSFMFVVKQIVQIAREQRSFIKPFFFSYYCCCCYSFKDKETYCSTFSMDFTFHSERKCLNSLELSFYHPLHVYINSSKVFHSCSLCLFNRCASNCVRGVYIEIYKTNEGGDWTKKKEREEIAKTRHWQTRTYKHMRARKSLISDNDYFALKLHSTLCPSLHQLERKRSRRKTMSLSSKKSSEIYN